MSAILDALVKLEQSVGGLEGSVQHLEGALAGQQRDMFGAPSQTTSQTAPANANSVDKQALVAKLDSIIEQAEVVLKEGRG